MIRFRFLSPLLILNFALAFFWTTTSASFFAPVHALQTTDTPTPGMFITVVTDELQINVRMGPSSSVYPIVGTLPQFSTAPVLGRSPGGDWIQIEYPGAPNNAGWVYSPLVQVSPGTLRIVDPPPTPPQPPPPTIDPTLLAQYPTIAPTATRPPTFTPAPPITVPAYLDAPASTSSSTPRVSIILGLAVIGVIGFILSLFVKKR